MSATFTTLYSLEIDEPANALTIPPRPASIEMTAISSDAMALTALLGLILDGAAYLALGSLIGTAILHAARWAGVAI
jgi:hypothetical protein